MWLVGDIGGTNSRLALADGSGVQADSLCRFANDDYSGIGAILRAYLADRAMPQALCLAVAGPVIAGAARLTNRDWRIEPQALCAATGAQYALLINDLSALGRAAATLPEHAAPWLSMPGDGGMPAPVGHGQGLVIGIGTGLNICAFQRSPAATITLEAEAGHASLPYAVCTQWLAALPSGYAPQPPIPQTAEGLFAGAGLARFARLRGIDAATSADVVARAVSGDGPAEAALVAFAAILGAYAREMALAHLPRGGLWLAGSVARGVLSHPAARTCFEVSFSRPVAEVPDLARQVPRRLIVDDMAALEGCRQAISEVPPPYS